MKRKIALALLMTAFPLCANAQTYVNEQNVKITEEEYQRLENLGFSQNQISSMSQDIFDENKDLVGYVETRDVKYYKTVHYFPNTAVQFSEGIMNIDPESLVQSYTIEISEEEYNNSDDDQIVVLGSETHQTDYKKLVTTISNVDSNNYRRVMNELTWKKMPATRSNDVFAIAINSSVVSPIANSQRAYTNYSVYDPCMLTTTSYQTNHTSNWTFSSQGYGVVVPLPSNSTKTYLWNLYSPYPCKDGDNVANVGQKNVTLSVNKITSTMYYNIGKLVANSKISIVDAYGSYQHAQKSVSLGNISFSISLKDGGISISFNPSITSSYDGMKGTHAQLTNLNW